jgi:hypothetical protein
MSLIFGLDFDDTFTADPKLWRSFVEFAVERGHQVVCVSAREDTESQREELRRALPEGVSVILLSYLEAKHRYAQSRGIYVDIWIDDYPEAIVKSYDGSDTVQLMHELSGENKQLWDENARLRIAVDEARRCRDNARNEAIEQLQKEMADLRAENARLKNK